MAKKKQLTESAANLATTTNTENQTPAAPADTYSTTREVDHKEGRQLISAWVDRGVWQDIRDLAQFRAAGGQRNHLGQAMSAGRLVEEALTAYINANRDELERWRAFSESMKQ